MNEENQQELDTQMAEEEYTAEECVMPKEPVQTQDNFGFDQLGKDLEASGKELENQLNSLQF